MNAITLNIENANTMDYLTYAGSESKDSNVRYEQYSQPTFCESFVGCFKNKYLHFGGRTRRSEYWKFQAWVVLLKVASLLASIGLFVGLLQMHIYNVMLPMMLLLIANLVIIIPQISSTVRRVHDTGRSGLWVGLLLVPIAIYIAFRLYVTFTVMNINSATDFDYSIFQNLEYVTMAVAGLLALDALYAIYLTVILCLDSEPNDNRYGTSEKYITP